jgi:hypothetical protein
VDLIVNVQSIVPVIMLSTITSWVLPGSPSVSLKSFYLIRIENSKIILCDLMGIVIV